MSRTVSQLGVEETNGVGEADVGVVEVAETAKRTDRQDHDSNATNTRKHLAVDVVLHHSRQTPAYVTHTHAGIYRPTTTLLLLLLILLLLLLLHYFRLMAFFQRQPG